MCLLIFVHCPVLMIRINWIKLSVEFICIHLHEFHLHSCRFIWLFTNSQFFTVLYSRGGDLETVSRISWLWKVHSEVDRERPVTKRFANFESCRNRLWVVVVRYLCGPYKLTLGWFLFEFYIILLKHLADRLFVCTVNSAFPFVPFINLFVWYAIIIISSKFWC